MNDENLVPMSKRSKDEVREIARKGGIKSGESRRRKKDLYQITSMMLNAELNDNGKEQVMKILGEELPEEALTTNALMVAGQIKSAIKGNTKAFNALAQFQDKGKIDDNSKKYTMPITDITSDFVEVYRAVHDSYEKGTYREFISKGGRGSIKSNFWASLVKETIKNDPQAHAVYTRRYKTDLRSSVYSQFKKTVKRDGEFDEWEFTTVPMMAKYKKTGQLVMFVGADKPMSLKSYNVEFGYVKILIHEECDEMEGVEQMDSIEDTFLRDDINAIDVKIYNPPKSKNNFMNKYTNECKTKNETYICHSYYYNVPLKWLGKRFFDRAEWFKQHKPDYYKNNYLGEVIGTGGGIFENIEEREITDEEINSFDSFHHGLDFGYVHPQVFIQCHYDYEKDIVYPTKEVYAKKCKNSTFSRKIKQYKDVELICDSARPDNIADMSDWGFNVVGAVKRWNNKGRAYCWEWLQTCNKIVVDPKRTPHLYEELTTLEHEILKDGTFSSAYPTLGEDCVMALLYSLNRVIREHTRDDEYEEDEILYEDEFENEEDD